MPQTTPVIMVLTVMMVRSLALELNAQLSRQWDVSCQLDFPLNYVYARSESSGETARMRRLA